MKRLVYFTLTMFFVLIAQAAGKQNFTISGKTLSSSHKVVVYDFALHKPLETVTVKDGAFTYTGSGYAGTYLELIDEHGKKSNLIIIDGEELSLDFYKLDSAAALAYDVHSIPFNLLLDGEGKIIAVNLRGKALGRKLKELYGREDGK